MYTPTRPIAKFTLLAAVFVSVVDAAPDRTSKESSPRDPKTSKVTDDGKDGKATGVEKRTWKARKRSEPRRRRGWERLPEDKRRELERLQEQLRRIPKEQREKMWRKLRSLNEEERLQALKEAQRREPPRRDPEDRRDPTTRHWCHRLWKSISPAERARIEKLPADQRREFFRRRLEKEREAQIRALPADVRKEIEAQPKSKRLRFLWRYQAEQSVRKVFHTPAELAELTSLPRHQLRTALLQRPRRGQPAPQRPAILSEATWKLWLSLSNDERLRAVYYLESQLRSKAAGQPGQRDRAPSKPTTR